MAPIVRVALTVSLLFFGAGCFGEAGVRYWGSVVAAPASGYSFDAKENPGKLPGIRGADVRLCICAQPCACKDEGRAVKTDVSGHYDIPTEVFPGMIGVDNYVVVRAAAEGFDAVTYTLAYDKRPPEARAQEPTDGEKALNFRLGPGHNGALPREMDLRSTSRSTSHTPGPR
jgi:hypothetical protein